MPWPGMCGPSHDFHFLDGGLRGPLAGDVNRHLPPYRVFDVIRPCLVGIGGGTRGILSGNGEMGLFMGPDMGVAIFQLLYDCTVAGLLHRISP